MEFSPEKYPTSINNVNRIFDYSYKWWMTIFFIGMYVLLNILLVYLLFPASFNLLSFVIVYGSLLVFSLVFIVLGFAFNNYRVGFGSVQYIKNVIQTPYIALFFILYYWKIKR